MSNKPKKITWRTDGEGLIGAVGDRDVFHVNSNVSHPWSLFVELRGVMTITGARAGLPDAETAKEQAEQFLAELVEILADRNLEERR